jgi:hypothetical protein
VRTWATTTRSPWRLDRASVSQAATTGGLDEPRAKAAAASCIVAGADESLIRPRACSRPGSRGLRPGPDLASSRQLPVVALDIPAWTGPLVRRRHPLAGPSRVALVSVRGLKELEPETGPPGTAGPEGSAGALALPGRFQVGEIHEAQGYARSSTYGDGSVTITAHDSAGSGRQVLLPVRSVLSELLESIPDLIVKTASEQDERYRRRAVGRAVRSRRRPPRGPVPPAGARTRVTAPVASRSQLGSLALQYWACKVNLGKCSRIRKSRRLLRPCT